MYDTSLCFLTATELAQKIRKGEISVVETMEAHLAQIEKVNPQVNALVTLLPEMAMEAALKADEKLARGEEVGPLHGLPVAHKDLVKTKGIRTTFGSSLSPLDLAGPNTDEPHVETGHARKNCVNFHSKPT